MNVPASFPRARTALAAAVWALLIWFFAATIDRLPDAADLRLLATGESAGAALLLAALFVAATLVRALRWRGLMAPVPVIPFIRVFAVFAWTFLASTVTPFRAGDALRPAWVHRQGGSFLQSAGALIAERLADLAVLAAFLLLAVAAARGDSGGVWAAGAAAPVLALLAAAALAPGLQRRTASGDGAGALARGFAALVRGLAQAAAPMALLRLTVLTLVVWGIIALGYHAVLAALFPALHWTAALAVPAAVNLAGMLPASPANLGPYEAAAVFILGLYGVPPDAALAAAIALHAVVLLTTALIGLAGRVLMHGQGTGSLDLV